MEVDLQVSRWVASCSLIRVAVILGFLGGGVYSRLSKNPTSITVLSSFRGENLPWSLR